MAFNNGITGTLPTELGDLSNLEYLDLNGIRDVTGTIPNATEWGQLTNLRQVRLSAPSFDPSPFPTYLIKVKTLEELFISFSHATGTLPTTIGNLTKLRGLVLEYNEFSASTMPTELGLLTDLVVLGLRDSTLEGQLPSELGHLTKLNHVQLGSNKLIGTIPTEMCTLSQQLATFNYDTCGPKVQPETSPCLQSMCGDKPSWGEARA